ncbi:MAG: hypothetical protein LH614_16810 [Pyrinomonadaceae bacterium]|nr:hypothetical protein [Pyrinomonadaceae bacterium]
MKIRWSSVLIFSFIAITSAAAQTRTVTNDDLEKYRQKRVAAQRDLRENYERLGFPSPAELERQNAESRAERSALAQRLETENLEREQLNLEREHAEMEARNGFYQPPAQNGARYDDDYYPNYAPNGFYGIPFSGYLNQPYDQFNRGDRFRRSYRAAPRIEYRNNLPVTIPPTRYTRWGSRNQ